MKKKKRRNNRLLLDMTIEYQNNNFMSETRRCFIVFHMKISNGMLNIKLIKEVNYLLARENAF